VLVEVDEAIAAFAVFCVVKARELRGQNDRWRDAHIDV
jgi:hypothetical protein